MERAYFAALRRAGEDPAVRAVVVTGAGKSFCPGMDSEAMKQSADSGISTDPELRDPQTLPRTIPKPTIAAINGACAGLGLVAALCCDLRFASDQAKITTAFPRRGIMAEHGIAWLLPRIVGTGRAMDLLLSGRVVQGQEALDLGLVNRLASPDRVVAESLDYARELAANCSPLAVGTIKRQVYEAEEGTLEEARLAAMSLWRHLLQRAPDFKEGASSLVDRRLPDYPPWDPRTPAGWDPGKGKYWTARDDWQSG